MTERVPAAAPTLDGEPLPERLISDVESLRALSDPLRLRILERMTADADGTWTVKRLASELGTSKTKLYHHVDLLLERGLIAVAAQRVVSGIIETSYRVAQRSVRLDPRLLAAESDTVHDALTTIFDGARDEIERGLRAGRVTTDADADPARRLLLARGLARLDPARAAAFRERLAALFEEFGGDEADDPASGEAYGLVLALYRMGEIPEDDR